MTEKVRECAGRPKFDPRATCPKRPAWVITAPLHATQHACLYHVHTVMKNLQADSGVPVLSVKPYTGL